jgi:hypothetical protein
MAMTLREQHGASCHFSHTSKCALDTLTGQNRASGCHLSAYSEFPGVHRLQTAQLLVRSQSRLRRQWHDYTQTSIVTDVVRLVMSDISAPPQTCCEELGESNVEAIAPLENGMFHLRSFVLCEICVIKPSSAAQ